VVAIIPDPTHLRKPNRWVGFDSPDALEPSSAYDAVRPLFEELARALDEDGFTEESGALEEQVMAPGVWMKPVGGDEAAEVTGLSIEGTRVSWR
jgi:hypothetical protein